MSSSRDAIVSIRVPISDVQRELDDAGRTCVFYRLDVYLESGVSWHVYRRFSELREFRKALIRESQLQGGRSGSDAAAEVGAIPFPHRKIFAIQESSLVRERQAAFELFFGQLLRLRSLTAARSRLLPSLEGFLDMRKHVRRAEVETHRNRRSQTLKALLDLLPPREHLALSEAFRKSGLGSITRDSFRRDCLHRALPATFTDRLYNACALTDYDYGGGGGHGYGYVGGGGGGGGGPRAADRLGGRQPPEHPLTEKCFAACIALLRYGAKKPLFQAQFLFRVAGMPAAAPTATASCAQLVGLLGVIYGTEWTSTDASQRVLERLLLAAKAEADAARAVQAKAAAAARARAAQVSLDGPEEGLPPGVGEGAIPMSPHPRRSGSGTTPQKNRTPTLAPGSSGTAGAAKKPLPSLKSLLGDADGGGAAAKGGGEAAAIMAAAAEGESPILTVESFARFLGAEETLAARHNSRSGEARPALALPVSVAVAAAEGAGGSQEAGTDDSDGNTGDDEPKADERAATVPTTLPLPPLVGCSLWTQWMGELAAVLTHEPTAPLLDLADAIEAEMQARANESSQEMAAEARRAERQRGGWTPRDLRALQGRLEATDALEPTGMLNCESIAAAQCMPTSETVGVSALMLERVLAVAAAAEGDAQEPVPSSSLNSQFPEQVLLLARTLAASCGRSASLGGGAGEDGSGVLDDDEVDSVDELKKRQEREQFKKLLQAQFQAQAAQCFAGFSGDGGVTICAKEIQLLMLWSKGGFAAAEVQTEMLKLENASVAAAAAAASEASGDVAGEAVSERPLSSAAAAAAAIESAAPAPQEAVPAVVLGNGEDGAVYYDMDSFAVVPAHAAVVGAFAGALRRLATLSLGLSAPGGAAEEAELVRPLYASYRTVMHQGKLREGSAWYLVGRNWWLQWCEYAGFYPPATNQQGQLDPVRRRLPARPGPMSDSHLLSDATTGELKLGVRLYDHVHPLPETVYTALQAWYGGGPPVLRRVARQRRGAKLELVLWMSGNDGSAAAAGEEESSAGDPHDGEGQDAAAGAFRKQTELQIAQGIAKRLPAVKAEDRAHPGTAANPLKWYRDALLDVFAANNPDRLADVDMILHAFPGHADAIVAAVREKYAAPGGHAPHHADADDEGGWAATPMKAGETGRDSQRLSSRIAPGRQGVVGLANLGNTCYMNSVLQCLSHTALLTQYFEVGAWKGDLNTSSGFGLGGKLAAVYARLIVSLHSTSRSYLRPSDFKRAIGTFQPMFRGFGQQDAHELLAFLLDGLSEDLNRVLKKPYVEQPDSGGRFDAELADEWWRNHLQREVSIVVALFTGQFKSLTQCGTCGFLSARFDPFTFLQLPLESASDAEAPLLFNVVFPDARPPLRCSVPVRNGCTIASVKAALAAMLTADAKKAAAKKAKKSAAPGFEYPPVLAQDLVVAQMQNGTCISRLMTDTEAANDLLQLNFGQLAIFVVPAPSHGGKNVQEEPPCPVLAVAAAPVAADGDAEHDDVMVRMVQRRVVRRFRAVYSPFSVELFGVPGLVRLPRAKCTPRALYARARQFAEERIASADAASAGLGTRGNEAVGKAAPTTSVPLPTAADSALGGNAEGIALASSFLLRRVDYEGVACSQRAYVRSWLVDPFGLPLDPESDEPLELDEDETIAMDWGLSSEPLYERLSGCLTLPHCSLAVRAAHLRYSCLTQP